MSAREIAILLAVLGLLQVFLALAARLLGRRLPLAAATIGIGFPLLFLAPWLLTSRLLVPSNDLAAAIPGAAARPAPDPHSLLSDVVYQLLPWELEVRHALSAARLPLWSDSLEGGSSPWVNPQSGVLSPIAFLARPLPIQHHSTAAHAIKMSVALEGAWLLAATLGAGPLGAAIGALSFALSGGIQSWALLPPSAVAAWAPWVALAAISIVRRPRPRRLLIGAVLIGALALSGNPEVAAYTIACAVVWALLLARRPISTRAAVSLGVALLLGAALAAPVLIPFLRHLPDAQRLDELAYSRVPLETLDWSPRTWFLPRDAPLLEAPLGSQVFGRPYGGLFRGTLNWAEAGAGYAGLVALAGSALALCSNARRRAVPFLLTSVLGLVIAAGFLPLRAAVAALPGAGLAATGRLLPLVALGLCVAGALGTSELVSGRLSRWSVVALVPIAALSLAADPRPLAVAAWIAIGVAVLWPRSASPSSAQWRRRLAPAGVALVAVLLVDLGPWALLQLPRGDTAAFYPVTSAVEMLRREAAAPGGPWRTSGEDLAVYPSLLSVYGLDEVRPHNPLAPRDYARVLYTAFGFSPARRYFSPLGNLGHPLLDFLNVRGLVSYSTRPGAPGFRPVPPTLDRIDAGELGTFRLLRNGDALPRIFVPTAADAIRADQIDDWVERMRDPRRVALFASEVGSWRPAPRRFDQGAVSIETWRPGRIALRLALEEGGLIATSIPGPAGWRARADGRELERVHVDGAFLGVRVPPGVERVTLDYSPPGFTLGATLGVAALVVVIVLGWVDRRALASIVSARTRVRWPRPRLALLAASAIVVYLAAGLARETMAALHPYWLRGPYSFRERNPARWRLESAPVERLRAFLLEVEPRIPDGSSVAFAGIELEGTEAAYRAMWATYLLPRHHVLPAGQAWDGEYYIAYRTRLDRAGLELMWESDDGALYRVGDPGAPRTGSSP